VVDGGRDIPIPKCVRYAAGRGLRPTTGTANDYSALTFDGEQRSGAVSEPQVPVAEVFGREHYGTEGADDHAQR